MVAMPGRPCSEKGHIQVTREGLMGGKDDAVRTVGSDLTGDDQLLIIPKKAPVSVTHRCMRGADGCNLRAGNKEDPISLRDS